MVKKLTVLFAYLSFFMLSLMYFTPKVSIYYFLESELKPYDVIISSETLEDNGFSLNVQNALIYVKSIESAEIKDLDVTIFGLYNSIALKDIKLSSTVGSFVPLNVRDVNVAYHLFNPLNVTANAIGEFGEAEVFLNLAERSLHVVLKPSDLMKKSYGNTLRNLKKSENGEFTYDKTF